MTQWTRSCNATRSTTSNLWKLGTLIALWTSATDDGFLRKNRSKQPPASIVQPALVPKRPFSTHEDLKEIKIRSSRPEVFLGESVLKICSKFTGGHPYRSAISIKLLGVLKGLVTHNDILKIHRTITIKIYFQNILKSFLKYFRNKHFSKQKSRLFFKNDGRT